MTDPARSGVQDGDGEGGKARTRLFPLALVRSAAYDSQEAMLRLSREIYFFVPRCFGDKMLRGRKRREVEVGNLASPLR